MPVHAGPAVQILGAGVRQKQHCLLERWLLQRSNKVHLEKWKPLWEFKTEGIEFRELVSRRCKRLNKQMRNSCQLESYLKQKSRGKGVQRGKKRGGETYFLWAVSPIGWTHTETKRPGILGNRAEWVGEAQGANLRQIGPGEQGIHGGTCAVGDSKDPFCFIGKPLLFICMSPARLGGAPWNLLTQLHELGSY